jgi:hypothetical protein
LKCRWSNQLEHSAAEHQNILWLYLLAATPWNLPPIDTYDILRSRIDDMPPGLIEYQLRMFTRHSRIHQDDIIVQPTSNSGIPLCEYMHQSLFWQPSGRIFRLNIPGIWRISRRPRWQNPHNT